MNLASFAELVAREESRIDLGEACLQIAQDVYPRMEPGHYLGEIERVAQRLRQRLSQSPSIEERIVALNEHLFGELGYRGNADQYYDPRNSYLNEVIDRRTGIPITLSVLYMEIGRRIDLALEGVSFPGHFLVRARLGGGMLVLDPFAGGVPQSEAELRERLQRVIPQGAVDVPVAELPLEQFLEPASKRHILLRLLRNLKSIYRDADEPERMLQVLNRMLVVQPGAANELRERGDVYQRLECWRPALEDLKAYLEREPDVPDVDEVRARVMELTLRSARLN